jgi:hypothetical protein
VLDDPPNGASLRTPGTVHAPGEQRADAIFTLPEVPATAVVLGDLPAWRAGLTVRGVEVLDDPGASPDLVVAANANDPRAAASAPHILLDGPPRALRVLQRTGRRGRRLLPIPVHADPVLLVPMAQRRAAAYGVGHGVGHEERWKARRNRAAAGLFRAGLFPPVRGTITTASPAAGPPALVAAARDLGVEPDRCWILLVSMGSPVRRDAFLLFRRGAATPDLALKFSRVPGRRDHVDREERGLALVAAAGGPVAARAPRFLGRLEVGPYHASLETAVVGTKLSTMLRQPLRRETKLLAVERAVDWLMAVATETASPPQHLAEERRRLADDVVPFWSSLGVTEDLVRGIEDVPAVFRHYDLGEENLVFTATGFGVVDWERAQPRGMPLADLAWLASAALRLVDGAFTEEGRLSHFLDLWRGQAPSSALLMRWVRDMVRALHLPPQSVGPLVTLTWLDRAKLAVDEHGRAEADTGRTLGRPRQERRAQSWLKEPGLGPGWSVWRQG